MFKSSLEAVCKQIQRWGEGELRQENLNDFRIDSEVNENLNEIKCSKNREERTQTSRNVKLEFRREAMQRYNTY